MWERQRCLLRKMESTSFQKARPSSISLSWKGRKRRRGVCVKAFSSVGFFLLFFSKFGWVSMGHAGLTAHLPSIREGQLRWAEPSYNFLNFFVIIFFLHCHQTNYEKQIIICLGFAHGKSKKNRQYYINFVR